MKAEMTKHDASRQSSVLDFSDSTKWPEEPSQLSLSKRFQEWPRSILNTIGISVLLTAVFFLLKQIAASSLAGPGELLSSPIHPARVLPVLLLMSAAIGWHETRRPQETVLSRLTSSMFWCQLVAMLLVALAISGVGVALIRGLTPYEIAYMALKNVSFVIVFMGLPRARPYRSASAKSKK